MSREFTRFLAQSCELKSVADSETEEETAVSKDNAAADNAAAAIITAARFVENAAKRVMPPPSPHP